MMHWRLLGLMLHIKTKLHEEIHRLGLFYFRTSMRGCLADSHSLYISRPTNTYTTASILLYNRRMDCKQCILFRFHCRLQRVSNSLYSGPSVTMGNTVPHWKTSLVYAHVRNTANC